MVKVSIIVPVYNVEKYVERCLESLINQTYQNIEIIIVVDGATDNSLEICENYKERDSRIQIVIKQNQGLGLARNTGLEYITGKYVLFVDSDDYVDINLVKSVTELAEKNECDLVRFHNYRENLVTGKKTVRKTLLQEGIYLKDKINKELLYPIIGVLPEQTAENFVGMSVWRNLYSSSIIKNHELNFVSEREYISEDIIFNIKYLYLCNKVYVTNHPFYHYIVNENSLTAKYKDDRFDKEIIMYKEILRLVDTLGVCKEEYLVREQRTFMDRSRMCMRSILDAKNLTYSQKRKKLKSICNNEELQLVISCYPVNKLPFNYKCIIKLIEHKAVSCLSLVYKILGKL